MQQNKLLEVIKKREEKNITEDKERNQISL